MAGYSGTPLVQKLGIKETFSILTINAPVGYRAMLKPLPASVKFTTKADLTTNIVHIFATKRIDLSRALANFRKRLSPEAIVWISWPKKSANMQSEITEDTVREVALPLGYVDVKVCAVNEIWSGLKLMVRKKYR